ncbi:unnamed protein product [Mycena citricolor]|uniref:Uncharacterized protein n=1 Tax=Mycena citricolor TaxID=2018698 RepID=A0AAD2HW89_9AGAR|nr:unnamed protein product [Mycena citricolor]
MNGRKRQRIGIDAHGRFIVSVKWSIVAFGRQRYTRAPTVSPTIRGIELLLLLVQGHRQRHLIRRSRGQRRRRWGAHIPGEIKSARIQVERVRILGHRHRHIRTISIGNVGVVQKFGTRRRRVCERPVGGSLALGQRVFGASAHIEFIHRVSELVAFLPLQQQRCDILRSLLLHLVLDRPRGVVIAVGVRADGRARFAVDGSELVVGVHDLVFRLGVLRLLLPCGLLAQRQRAPDGA